MAEKVSEENLDPIEWDKDKDELIVRKIEARISDTKTLHSAKLKQYRLNEAYLEGEQDKIDPSKPKTIYNHVFPIIRNMTGLVTDVKPRPAAKVGDISEDTPAEVVDQYLKLADKIEKSLEEWFEDFKMQSRFQEIIFSLLTYDDFFIMPYWDSITHDTAINYLHPRHIHLDPNATSIDDAEFVVLDLYKSRKWVRNEFSEKELPPDEFKRVQWMDYTEAQVIEMKPGEYTQQYKLMKNVAKVELYIEPEFFAYKIGDHLVRKFRNPTWALTAEQQKADVTKRIQAKYHQDGIGGAVGKVTDVVKGAVGMETTDDKISQEVEAALTAFTPSDNYFSIPRIPVIQFSTYRMAGEQYSRSIMKNAIPTIDDMNMRKEAISRSAESIGEPTVFVNGSDISEEQARKMKSRSNKPIRVPTKSNRRITDVIHIQAGTPVPEQFFEDLQHNERALDNLFGHHEVSKGAGDARSRTKGGILALQEADQTPVRYLSRNIEDSFQALFGWIIQLRKVQNKKLSVGNIQDMNFIDYALVDSHIRVFVKSGSMLPVSREQQRQDAMDMWNSQAIDPLTFHERMGDPHPEKTAERLQLWVSQKRILTDQASVDQEHALEQIRLIKENRFSEAGPQPNDNPMVHHDMLIMALRSNMLSPEQQKFAASLIQHYAAQAGNPVAPPGNAPPAPPPTAGPPPSLPPTAPAMAPPPVASPAIPQ